MRAYIDRVLVRELEVENPKGGWTDDSQPPVLKTVEVISAGMSTNGLDNSELNGKKAYISGKATGIPQVVDGETLYIYRLHNIETVED